MECLVAENHVDGFVWQHQPRRGGLLELDDEPFLRRFQSRDLEHRTIDIDADHASRAKALLQQPEGAATTAADIDDGRIAGLAIQDQALKITQRPLEHVDRWPQGGRENCRGGTMGIQTDSDV